MLSRSIYFQILFCDSEKALSFAAALSPGRSEDAVGVSTALANFGIKNTISKWSFFSIDSDIQVASRFCEFTVEKGEEDKLTTAFFKSLGEYGATLVVSQEMAEENEDGIPSRTSIFLTGKKVSKKDALHACDDMSFDEAVLVAATLNDDKKLKSIIKSKGNRFDEITIFEKPFLLALLDQRVNSKTYYELIKSKKFNAALAASDTGDSLLHKVIEYYSEYAVQICQCLIENGASVTHRNLKGRTPLHVFMDSPHDRGNLLFPIVATAASVNIKDEAGMLASELMCCQPSWGGDYDQSSRKVSYTTKMIAMGLDVSHVSPLGNMAWLARKNDYFFYLAIVNGLLPERLPGPFSYSENQEANLLVSVEHEDSVTFDKIMKAHAFDQGPLVYAAASALQHENFYAFEELGKQVAVDLNLLTHIEGKYLSKYLFHVGWYKEIVAPFSVANALYKNIQSGDLLNKDKLRAVLGFCCALYGRYKEPNLNQVKRIYEDVISKLDEAYAGELSIQLRKIGCLKSFLENAYFLPVNDDAINALERNNIYFHTVNNKARLNHDKEMKEQFNRIFNDAILAIDNNDMEKFNACLKAGFENNSLRMEQAIVHTICKVYRKQYLLDAVENFSGKKYHALAFNQGVITDPSKCDSIGLEELAFLRRLIERVPPSCIKKETTGLIYYCNKLRAEFYDSFPDQTEELYTLIVNKYLDAGWSIEEMNDYIKI